VVMIVLMSASTFTTQRQLMMKNMPASALDNPFAKQQKMLLYLMPIFFAISGVNFPIGVLLYWLTTNVWSMCQQFYVIRKMPAPGSLAEKAMQERRRKKGKPVEEFTVKGLDKAGDVEAPKVTGQRVQPSRNKKKKGTAGGPAKKQGPGSTSDPKPQTDN
jgi:YidC/Oxa1 family membrane protein insertase